MAVTVLIPCNQLAVTVLIPCNQLAVTVLIPCNQLAVTVLIPCNQWLRENKYSSSHSNCPLQLVMASSETDGEAESHMTQIKVEVFEGECCTPTAVKGVFIFDYSYSMRVKAILGEVGWSGVLLAPEQGVRVEDPVLQQVPDHVTKQYTICI